MPRLMLSDKITILKVLVLYQLPFGVPIPEKMVNIFPVLQCETLHRAQVSTTLGDSAVDALLLGTANIHAKGSDGKHQKL